MLPRVGESLDPASTLEALARRRRRPDPICPGCRTHVLPRGYDVRTGLCWFCIFPNVGTAVR